mmetsp:Transcript_29412/g.75486  ORF Transcript_29412/g.75486 Transcript_29412/m.75486 type:complete len:236 (+) Transcript_29412:1-708(+)
MLVADSAHVGLVGRLLVARAAPLARDCSGRLAVDFARAAAARADVVASEPVAAAAASPLCSSAAAVATACSAATACALLEEATAKAFAGKATYPTDPRVVEEVARAAAETAATARAGRRRKREVAYEEGDHIQIQWLIEEGAEEVLVLHVAEGDRAHLAGVGQGWALLSVDGRQDLLQCGHAERQRIRLLRPPVRLEFGRPLHFPKELWLARVSSMVEERQPRRQRPVWEASARR